MVFYNTTSKIFTFVDAEYHPTLGICHLKWLSVYCRFYAARYLRNDCYSQYFKPLSFFPGILFQKFYIKLFWSRFVYLKETANGLQFLEILKSSNAFYFFIGWGLCFNVNWCLFKGNRAKTIFLAKIWTRH